MTSSHGKNYFTSTSQQTTNLASTNSGKIRSFPLTLPPLAEQRQILSFLDEQTTKIDALIAKKQRLIELLQEKRTALISHAVTKGLGPGAPLKETGVGWIGTIPDHWACAPLNARYRVQLGKMLDAKRITGDNLAPYIRNIDVQWDHVNVNELPEMDFDINDRNKYLLLANDLLVCEGGEAGRAALWKEELAECYYQKAIHRLRPYSYKDMPRFLFYVLYAAAKLGVFVAEGNQNTIDHLTAEKLRRHRLPFPPLDEQRRIIAFLDQEKTRIDALISDIIDAIEKIREYRTALISATVVGKIDVRGEVD